MMIMVLRYVITGASLAAMYTGIYSVDAQQYPKFVGDIKPVITTTGGQTMLNCTVRGISFRLGQSVVWAFIDNTTDGKLISQDTYMFLRRTKCNKYVRKYDVIKRELNDITTFSLLIRCLDQSDTGIYSCSMYLPGVNKSSVPTQNASLFVKADVQQLPTIDVGIEPVIELPGGEAMLNCTVTGINLDLKQSVIWTYLNHTTGSRVISADVMLQPLIFKRCPGDVAKYKVMTHSFLYNITYSLVIRCLDESDTGIYQCSIFQPGFTTSLLPAQNGTLIVKEPDRQDNNCTHTYPAKSATAEMGTTFKALFIVVICAVIISH